jgi:hypothetical protein
LLVMFLVTAAVGSRAIARPTRTARATNIGLRGGWFASFFCEQIEFSRITCELVRTLSDDQKSM